MKRTQMVINQREILKSNATSLSITRLIPIDTNDERMDWMSQIFNIWHVNKIEIHKKTRVLEEY